MKKNIFFVLCLNVVLNLSAGEGLIPPAIPPCPDTVSWINPRVLGYLALGGLGLYALCKIATNIIHQQEERIILDRENEIEDIEISKKDHALICSLIDAMEQDLDLFEQQPNLVKNFIFDDFDSSEMAKGCEGMRNFFCSIYEQCIQEPDNKAFLEEVVMIFKQTIIEKTIIA